MRYKLAASLAVAVMVLTLSKPAGAISFTTFVQGGDINSTLGQNSTIGFSYAGNKFVGSVYFGTNNNQLYQTDLSGLNVQLFGPPIPGASGEIYVSSSFGLGGFPSRDIYATQNNGIFHITNNGSSGSPFVSGLSGGVRGIAFDPYGSYGNDMIVTTTSGAVYRVNNSGTATILANVGEDTEGLDFTPQPFGPFPTGTLVVASEGSGRLRAISPTGVITDLGVVVQSAEMLSFVPLTLGSSGSPLEGFYAARYPDNIQKAGATEFVPYLGDAIVTGETTQLVYQVEWGGSSFAVNTLGSFGGQPEDGIFVTAKIIEPIPTAVPEPGSILLLSIGLCCLGIAIRLRSSMKRGR